MLELPETTALARQITENLSGRVVTALFNATHPHKFTWYAGDPEAYPALLGGRKIVGAEGHGAFVDILFEGDLHLAFSDGAITKEAYLGGAVYYCPGCQPL